MKPDEYIEKVKRTESLIFKSEGKERLLHAGIGIATEAGEMLDALKKSLFYNQQLDKINIEEELGDLMWYIALACDSLNVSLENIMERNIEKLKARYPEKFTSDDAKNRDLKKERDILEKK
ncbi:nucleoside triphosphate pyrophosphohydrolase family protein [Candidatus Aenigmatarchaeota archaeon]